MQGQQVDVFRVATRGPGDVTGIMAFVDSGGLDPTDIVAILGKTEGNGGVNDFTREYATRALCAALAPRLGIGADEVEDRIAFVMSGGTEGVLSPHVTIFARRPARMAPSGEKRLSVGIAMTRPFLPEEIGRVAQVEETARAVRLAMADAVIDRREDVHFVQIKCPLLTAERVEAALGRGRSCVTKNGYASMAFSRGASALGVATALEEIAGPVAEDAIGKDWRFYSKVASASAGIELMRSLVIVMGNSAAASSRFVIGHGVMRDAIDLHGVLSAFSSVGLLCSNGPISVATERIVNVFAKAEASPSGLIRGCRHTMLDDTDLSSTRHARAAVGGLIAGVSGHGGIYVSGGAEHQGPPGGGPVAVIASL